MHLLFITLNTILLFILIMSNLNDINAKHDNSLDSNELQLLVTTVATDVTDGFIRFNRSINTYGLKLEVLGLNEKWLGGNVATSPGGGQKVNLLKKFIEKHRYNKNLIVLFVDSYDVIITSSEEEIVKRFVAMDANIVFSSEDFCWPDKTLAVCSMLIKQNIEFFLWQSKYPNSDENGQKYLNSGGFIGYASQIYDMVHSSDISDSDDDQLFYTKIYIDHDMREKLKIKLDRKANLFQNLNGAVGDVEIRFSAEDAFVQNTAFQTNPLIIHGNGPSKITLNSLGNYLAKSWHPLLGCHSCNENLIDLSKLSESQMPLVLIGLFVEHKTPFFTEFIEHIIELNYPKSKINIFIHNSQSYHSSEIQTFIDQFRQKYRGITVFGNEKMEWEARNAGLDHCVKVNCDYYLSVDSDARLTNPDTLKRLIEHNRTIIAPLLVRPNQLWSNFWGALSSEGFYSRSHDYIQIVKNERRGIWNVPFVNQAYLIKGSLLKGDNSIDNEIRFSPTFFTKAMPDLDPEMTFCKVIRDHGIFIFVDNLEDFGHLVDSSTFDTNRVNPDLYEIYSNQKDWQKRYIHPNYSRILSGEHQIEQPCPDVYWFPVVNPIFCRHLIEIMENFGQWSEGKNKDPRLAGGYENVPTRDIHMNQVGLEQHWLYFLREFIRPVQEKVFIGYYHDPPKAIMNFVVRYNPSEQAYLRPHHDASTYTVNLALNSPKIDYEVIDSHEFLRLRPKFVLQGGGCRFLRYNCSITNLRVGWSLIHPGRLTHYHEGLAVTKGTRYIMVSFVDP